MGQCTSFTTLSSLAMIPAGILDEAASYGKQQVWASEMKMLWLLFWKMCYAFLSFMEYDVEVHNLESGLYHKGHLN